MIWCVEDDTSIREIELYALRATGMEAEAFKDGAEMWDALHDRKPKLILLDVMLPNEDGISILQKLKSRADTANIPVIMATAKGMEFDKVQALDLGADDYLVKPFGMMEMISRIKAVLRRSAVAPAPNLLEMNGVSMNIEHRTVAVDNERVSLTYKEYELLKLFLTRPGMVFTREQLFASVWGENHLGESRTIDMHIRTLRQKLGAAGERIETVRNVGYRWESEKR